MKFKLSIENTHISNNKKRSNYSSFNTNVTNITNCYYLLIN